MTVTEGISRRQPVREPAARTYPRALPIVPVRARGLTVEGADGRRYLDCLSGAGTLPLGHNHPVVLEAIRTVLDSGAPLNVPDLATPVEDAFVTELLRTLPPGLADHARVQFCGPTSTDAVEAAYALVRAATGRTDVLALVGAEHGRTSDVPPSASAPETSEGRNDAFAVRGRPLPYPHDYRRPSEADATRGAELAARWTEDLLDSQPPGTSAPAGVILQTVQDEGGVLPAPDTWVRAVRRSTATRSIPLIVDETRTGVGRTGAFWAVEHSGVTPDVMVLSEAIGGSLPLALVVHRDDFATDRPSVPSVPLRGNQLAMAAGAATLAHVREHQLAERAAALGTRMLSQLRELARQSPRVGDVRGRGLMLGVELVTPAPAHTPDSSTPDHTPTPHSPAPELAAAVQRECLRRGLIVGLGGRHMNVVRLLPPLTISDEQASAVLDRLSDALVAATSNSHHHTVCNPAARGTPRQHARARHTERAP
ncbi:aminotransferase class III-fold pyridoxal phosphate-dependent enzyme [Streptomyces cadmiisoli]|uniref:Diaminobutyrate--2-oxoglutarate transaminase n=1 Tax=Streptomyces cadmiisoli TaxID=2184053 RepID=A0A2Z4IX69_9ACTN|nr:aspartate aminotransferase family protein [Streptomyces cadmiisoli]